MRPARVRVDAIVVPRGAEASAVQRGWQASGQVFVCVPAGSAAAGPALDAAGALETALVLGLCGALDPALRVGDSAVYACIVDGPHSLELDAQLTAACAALLGSTPLRATNVRGVVTTAAAKAKLRAATGAAAIDMEGFALARVLLARGVRVAMVRVVSDDALSDLPDLQDVYDAGGALRPVALLRAFAHTPNRSLRFIRDAMAALAALRRAAQRLSG